MTSSADSANHGATYLYIDEAGNFDFSPNGTQHFLLTGVLMRRPFVHLHELLEVKYDMLEGGLDLEYFHASEDRQAVRDRVFRGIASHAAELGILSVVAKKDQVAACLRSPEWLYVAAFDQLVHEAFATDSLGTAGQVIVVTDSLPVRRSGAVVRKAVRSTLKAQTPKDVTFRLLHHASRSDVNLQVTDYCAWALFRRWERGDDRSYRIVVEGGVRTSEMRLRHSD